MTRTYPLSPGQQRLWFLHRLDPADASYNVPVTLRISGPLDAGALELAWDELMARHDMLRVRFRDDRGTAVQWIDRQRPPLQRLEPAAPSDVEAARGLLRLRANQPFDLVTGPVLRAGLIRLADDDHLLGIVVHHIAADGWSVEVLLRELSELYAAATSGKPNPLPPVAASYLDLIAERPAGADDDAVAYWTRELAGAPALELPTDRPRRPVRSGRGGRHAFELPAGLMSELDALARAERCTLFTVLLAAFQVLLARHSGQHDVSVGTPVLGREDPDDAVVGHFAGTVVIRTDLGGDPTFREVLRATRARVLGAFGHPDVPYERVLSGLRGGGDRSRTPLYQAMFMLLHQHDTRPRLGELPADIFDQGLDQARTDVSLDVYRRPGNAQAVLAYDSDLFDHATAGRWARRYRTLLADVLARPGARIGELALLDPQEGAELARWNDTGEARPRTGAYARFAERVAERPDATAIVWCGRPVSYAELAARAGRLAALLEGRCPPGGLVAVCLPRSPDLVAALLAAWRLGAAYLPLDPEYPPERIALVAEDSRADVVLTERSLVGRFGAARVALVDDAPATADAAPARDTDPEDVAYVLYTSGSTGRPKGVAVPHRALGTFLSAMTGIFGDQRDATWLALTSLSFDISALELMLPLTSGGRVVLAPDAALRDGPALLELVEAGGVDHVQATPSGWRLLLEAGFTGPHVTALVGGEALPVPLAAELRGRVARLVNMYGPTETTIWSSTWEVPPGPRRVAIGGPIAGTRLHVLDDRLFPVPVGVAGELYIAGDGVTRGYLRRPALTAERFLPDPSGPPGARMYRTGDRVRRLPDGGVEFLGRTDNQVKLRGHRIELGEIEAVLGRHPLVRAAAVVVRDETLVAYVAGPAEVAGELPAHAAAVLPPYMVPGTVVVLDELPLTPNGKLDRKALPAVDARAAGPARPHAEPATPAQRQVAAVFAEVLGVDRVGADDDFFALGGHSLLAAKAVARLGRVPIAELFANPTVAGFAAVAERHAGGTVPLARRAAGEPARLSPAQARLWLMHRLEPDSAAYNMYNVWRLRGPLDVAAFAGAVAEVVRRHEVLRTRYPETADGPVAVVEPDGRPVLSDVDTVAGEDEARARVAELVNAPFELTGAAPLRIRLFRLAEDDHVCCLVLHHIAGDGWSLNLLRRELAEAYAGRPGPPGPVLQYADIDPAYWRLGGEELAYWRSRLAAPTVLELPTDHPRPAQPAHRGGFHVFELPGDVTDGLERLGRSGGATLFMVLLAAYQVLLDRHTGQTDVLVGSPAAGRDLVEFEPVVGYFTRTLVFRGDLAGDPTFAELLERTRRTVLEAIGHRDVPYEELLADLGVQRDPSRTPLFQTMMILHTQDEQDAPDRFADLAFELFDPGYGQAKFDLMLEGWRTPGGLLLTLDYDRDLFEPATVAALAERFALLLREVVAGPDRRIGALPLLTGADRRRLESWGSGGAARRRPVPQLFADTVRRAPEATALVCGDETTSYAELAERAAGLAGRLRGHRIVGVCLGRSPGMVVALLAAWHAGAAYLPLDPAYPPDRLAAMVADAGATAVVTDAAHAGLLPDGVQLVDVAAPGPPAVPCTPGPDAYVIYTSGSTGTPKGVLVEHAALAARVAWMLRRYGLGPDDRVVQFASLSFDTHAEEIFPALAAGAGVVLLPDGGRTLPDFLATGPRVTVLDLPTAYWHQLVDLIDQVRWPEALRLVILGGEQAHAAAVARWREHFGDRVALLNTYGPTETTIIATAALLDASADRPPIGRPIDGTSAAVLDRAGRPVPPGVAGELAIGGAGVARGYLGRPALTAERFEPDPLGPPGARRYRTGDLVRWRADGQLEFLGRIDDQVKVRGFRVEPGEVEACLTAHPAVGDAAVIADGDRLVGFVVGEVTDAQMRRHAAAALPPHLVPSLFVAVDRLPLTVTGKVDRDALRRRAARHERPAAAPAPAARVALTDVERLVAEVWRDVLGVAPTGAEQDFFALGGHSLSALRVTARVGAAVEAAVPIRTLFEQPTLGGFAAAVEALLLAELDGLSDEEAARLLAEADEEMGQQP
ncbi:amino acid adenylation domain-containing protein [Dactylosporangium salmoneum]|uniref:Carrier domain-containing protein n=1 Tax=Dactylosporangium salmoneum TaxID=53361 RepID=A0ABP5U8X6_9ACTN